MNGNDEMATLLRTVIGLAMKVHRTLGQGFVEVVYQNALVIELRKANLGVECQYPVKVKYENVGVGEFTADLLVGGAVLIELKAVRAFDAAHEVQLVNYLQATGLETGLLLNFGAPSLQFRTKTRVYFSPPANTAPDLA